MALSGFDIACLFRPVNSFVLGGDEESSPTLLWGANQVKALSYFLSPLV